MIVRMVVLFYYHFFRVVSFLPAISQRFLTFVSFVKPFTKISYLSDFSNFYSHFYEGSDLSSHLLPIPSWFLCLSFVQARFAFILVFIITCTPLFRSVLTLPSLFCTRERKTEMEYRGVQA